MLVASVIQLIYQMGYHTWLFFSLQIRHQHVNVEVLTLKEAKQTALIAWFAIINADYRCCFRPKHPIIESFDLFLVLLWQV